jgi:hypothetical protein
MMIRGGISYRHMMSRDAFIEDRCKIEEAIQKLLAAKVVPTEENLHKMTQKSKRNDVDYMLYVSANKKFKFNFLKGQKPKNEVEFYFSLMSYVQLLTQKAKAADVHIPEEFSFAFEPYIKKSLIPRCDHIPHLYRQSKMLAQLMMLLYESNDHGIDLRNVVRESVEHSNEHSRTSIKNTAALNMDHAQTLDERQWTGLRCKRQNTYRFVLDFNAYTNTLRHFINKLQEYNLPVIIRFLNIKTLESNEDSDCVVPTKKVNVVLGLEWLIIENGKNRLHSELMVKE